MGFLIVDIVYLSESRKTLCVVSLSCFRSSFNHHIQLHNKLSQNQPNIIHIFSHAPKKFLNKKLKKIKNKKVRDSFISSKSLYMDVRTAENKKVNSLRAFIMENPTQSIQFL